MRDLACIPELLNFIEQRHKDCKVTVMPDFFLDRLISLNWATSEFLGVIEDVAKRKGGSVDGISQMDIHGGNAVNVALALANLGVEVTPIICTSHYGVRQLNYYFDNTTIDVSHLKEYDRASVTTALEFKSQEGKTNVMLRDVGSLADFSAESLSEDDYRAIEDADYLCLFNWAGTLKNGTSLAQAVFGRAKKIGKAKTYYDTADPSPNKPAISGLIEKVLKASFLDVLSVNENEAVIYASILDEPFNDKKGQLDFTELALEAARIIARHVQARVDLHTTAFSATIRGKTEVVAPTFKVKVRMATGAGDAWTSGNIVGDHNELSDMCRLTLANAVSACYLSDPRGNHPSWEGLKTFLRQAQETSSLIF